MLEFLLLNSTIVATQPKPNPQPNLQFSQLKSQLESYGFEVNIALPPSLQLPNQQPDFQRRRVRKPYGLLDARNKSIWINPVVFELGISNAVLIHEATHAAQVCLGNGEIQTIGLDIEPIRQAQPFFKRYVDTHAQAIEKEAYAVQTQSNSFDLVTSLLNQHCQFKE